MRQFLGARAGFAFYELMLVVALTTILAGVVYVNFAAGRREAREASLRSNVATLRIAIARYYQDHGVYPCGNGADGIMADAEMFERQLEWHTDGAGRVSRVRTEEYCFGPYLDDLPLESLTGSAEIVIDTISQRTLPSLAGDVSAGRGEGGWYYEPRSGNVVANLGEEFDSKYARY